MIETAVEDRALPEPVAGIARLAPYAVADLPASSGSVIALAQNESLRGPSPRALEAAAAALSDGALYPDAGWRKLRAALAAQHGLDEGQILCAAGSMELIRGISMAYLGPGLRAVAPAHAYPYFLTATALMGAETDLVAEVGMTVDVDALLAAIRSETRVLWLANPGNPTGTALPAAEIMRLREALPSRVLLVLDEAYGEFAEEGPFWPLVGHGDTVVLRTFSKAYGLAGFRIGWGLFPPAIAEELNKVLPPGGVTAASQAAALAALQDQAYMHETVEMTAALRDDLAARARALGFEVPVSRANFVLLRFGDAERAARADARLRAGGVYLRPAAGAGLPHCLRATVGPAAAMAVLVRQLEAVMREGGAP
ncbi:MAG: histidinol-phosphate transaminase [Pseudomonadota bacterium]